MSDTTKLGPDYDYHPFTYVFQAEAERALRIATEHGFEESWEKFGEKIALMHAELSEALEGERHNNPPSEHIPSYSAVEEEFADVIIRIMSFAYKNNLRVGEALLAKQEFNNNRPFKHGGKKF
jgi:NTP pyrophosphatase (non-canonical NTP hydrolase)